MVEKKYSLQERVAVKGTGKDEKNFPKGVTRKIHPRVADKLVKSGVVTKA